MMEDCRQEKPKTNGHYSIKGTGEGTILSNAFGIIGT